MDQEGRHHRQDGGAAALGVAARIAVDPEIEIDHVDHPGTGIVIAIETETEIESVDRHEKGIGDQLVLEVLKSLKGVSRVLGRTPGG